MRLSSGCRVTSREACGVPDLVTLTAHESVPVSRIQRCAREPLIKDQLACSVTAWGWHPRCFPGVHGHQNTHEHGHKSHDQASQDELFGPFAPTPERVVHGRGLHRELAIRRLGDCDRKRSGSHEAGAHLPSVTVCLESFRVPPVKTGVACTPV
jgi:hypothetical protein